MVDLSSLWSGPLCAQLLGLAGARVVKITDMPQMVALMPSMIDTMKSMKTMMLTMYATQKGMQDQQTAGSENATAMGQAFDAAKNDDSFYLPPETFNASALAPGGGVAVDLPLPMPAPAALRSRRRRLPNESRKG